MKTLKIFSMAALALVMAACSSDDNVIEQQPAQQQGKMHFTATIEAPNSGATTRTTYTEDGTTINVAWKSGDQIALIHGGVKDVVTVGTPNPDGSAPISGTITVGADNEAVAVVYPAASVDATGSGAVFTPNMTYITKGLTQDGTLGYIADYLDSRYCNANLSVSGDPATASLKTNVKLNSTIVIWKLTLSSGGSALNATAVTVKVGSTSVAAAASASAKSEYYLCLVPGTMGTGDLTIEATVGSDAYIYTKAGGVSLTAGLFYQSTVTMTKKVAASKALSAVTASELGWRIGSDGNAYEATGTLPTGVSAVAKIVYVGIDNGEAAPYNNGLALALSDVSGSMIWCSKGSGICLPTQYSSESDAKNDMSGIANTDALVSPSEHTHYPAIAARNYNGGVHPTGTSAWFLPSAGQWDKMANTAGGYNKLGLNSARYWSSTQGDASHAWRFSVDDGNWGNNDKLSPYYIRPCLAF